MHVKLNRGVEISMRNRKTLEELTLADDFIFCKVMSKDNIAKYFLERLFEKRISSIKLQVTQSTIDTEYASHGVRFDIEFVGDDTVYDIEMQQKGGPSEKEQYSLLRRTRYYQASMDTRYLSQGDSYDNLPETRIIFICTFDPFGKGLAKYTQVSTIQETGAVVSTGASVVYLNAAFREGNVDSEVFRFLCYLREGEVSSSNQSEFINAIDTAVKKVKLDPTARRDFMSLEEIIRNERAEEREDTRREGIQNCMKKFGITYDEAFEALYPDAYRKSRNTGFSKMKFDK